MTLVDERNGEAAMPQIVRHSHFLGRLYMIYIQFPLQLAIARHMPWVPVHPGGQLEGWRRQWWLSRRLTSRRGTG